MALMLQGCPKDIPVKNAFADYAYGQYEWDSTTTPTHKLTPDIVGYSQQIKIRRNGYNSLVPASVSFYRNDTLQRQYFEPQGDSAEVKELDNKNALIKYILPGPGSSFTTAYIRYRLETTNVAASLIVSKLLNLYSEKADTVHHYRVVLPLRAVYPPN